MLTIALVRHGESLANAGHRTTDPAQIALTERGWHEAEAVAALLERPDLVVTSAYRRTKETAAPTLARFTQVERAEWPIHELTYLAPSNCVQSTAAERAPLVQAYWERCDPWFVDGPGAESWADCVQRGVEVRRLLEQAQAQRIVLFSHGQFIKLLVALLVGPTVALSAEGMRAWRHWALREPIENCQVLRLSYAPAAGWRPLG